MGQQLGAHALGGDHALGGRLGRGAAGRQRRRPPGQAADSEAGEIMRHSVGAQPSGRSSCQAKPSTTRRVVALFFSILVTTTAPISAVLATWVPPQGWKSISARPRADADGADAAGAARRLHRHALDQRRVGVELLVGDRAHRHRMAGRHQPGDAGGERFLVQRVGHVEVQPRVVGRDRAAVDQLRHQVAQQVGGGVEAHQPVAALPVDAGGDGVAGLAAAPAASSWSGAGTMADVGGRPAFGVLALARVGDGAARCRRPAPARRCRRPGRRPADRTPCGPARCRARRCAATVALHSLR